MIRLYFVASILGVIAVLWIAHETGVLIIPVLARIFGRLALVKSLLFRRGLTKAGIMLLLPLVPMIWRSRARRWKHAAMLRVAICRQRFVVWWKALPLWRKVLTAGPAVLVLLAILIVSFGLAGLTFLPVFGLKEGGQWLARSWLIRRMAPLLAKMAGKLGIDRVVLFLFAGLPAGWRVDVRRGSRRLARTMIRSRMRARAALRRARRQAAQPPPVPDHPRPA